MGQPTPRQMSFGLHALWLALTLGNRRLERRLSAASGVEGLSMLFTIVGWYGLLIGIERRRPHDPAWSGTAVSMRTDAAFFALSAMSATTASGRGANVAARVVTRRQPAPLARLGNLGGLTASLLVSELVHYSLHRLSHEWGPAWRVHSVHHSPPGLNLFNATRFHPTEQAIEGALDGFALGLIGLSPTQHLTHGVARATYGQLQHLNAELDSGPLDHIFSTPDLHRWHHSEIYAEGDNNYGAVLSVWDRLLGSFFRPARRFDANLGVGRMPDFPQRLAGLLAAPFQWAAIKHRNRATWCNDAPTPDANARA